MNYSDNAAGEVWNSIVIANHGSPLHSWEWARAKELNGDIVRWFFVDTDSLICAIPIYIKVKFGVTIGWIPDGFRYSGNIDIFKKHLKDFMKKNSIKLIFTDWFDDCYNTSNNNFLHSLPFSRKRETFVIDLKSIDKDSLVKKYNKTTRKYVNRSIREGVEFLNISTTSMDIFYNEYKKLSTKKHFKPVVSNSFFMTLVHLMNQKSGLRHVSLKSVVDKQVLGYMTTLVIGKNALEFLRVDLSSNWEKYSSKFLTHSVLLESKILGVELYNFGGVEKGNNPGIYNHKRSFGGDFIQTEGLFFLI
jgi:hypothetical protein